MGKSVIVAKLYIYRAFQFVCINMTHLSDYETVKMTCYDTWHDQSPAKPRIAWDLTNLNCWHRSCVKKYIYKDNIHHKTMDKITFPFRFI